MTSFPTPSEAREYLLAHDNKVKAYNRMSKTALSEMLRQRRRADGIVSLTGTSGWSKDELLNELIRMDYPDADMDEARQVYYAATVTGRSPSCNSPQPSMHPATRGFTGGPR